MSFVTVEFSTGAQSLSAIRSAAYRLIGKANCEITQVGKRWSCTLSPLKTARNPVTLDEIEQIFRDLVTDENLREQIADRTSGVRNVVLSLAFGALAEGSAPKK